MTHAVLYDDDDFEIYILHRGQRFMEVNIGRARVRHGLVRGVIQGSLGVARDEVITMATTVCWVTCIYPHCRTTNPDKLLLLLLSLPVDKQKVILAALKDHVEL